jgi:RNA polymerase sigma factor (sigma-70 family)
MSYLPTEVPTVFHDELAMVREYLAWRDAGAWPTREMEDAWDDFFTSCSHTIRRFAFSCGIADADVSDCVQEVWRELLVRLPSFRVDPKRGKFDTWLYAIVRSKAVDCLRKRTCILALDRSQSRNDAPQRSDDRLQGLEQQEFLSSALAQLSDRLSTLTYRVLYLRLVEQQSAPKVAKALGLSQQQVWYRYHRGRDRLQGILQSLANNTVVGPSTEARHARTEKNSENAQGMRSQSVSRGNARNGNAMDFVLKRLELGRQGTGPEWKVEWSGATLPEPILHVRKLSMVAYAEICGPEEIINAYWPQITNAAIAAGVAAGIATIIVTPTAALSVFRSEFSKQLGGKMRKEVTESIRVALSAQQEPNGPWTECTA